MTRPWYAVDPKPPPRPAHRLIIPRGLLIGLLFGAIGALQILRGIPLWVAAFYTIASVVTVDLWLARH